MYDYECNILDAPTAAEIEEDKRRESKMIEDLNKAEEDVFNSIYNALEMGICLSQVKKISEDAINTFEKDFPCNFTLEK